MSWGYDLLESAIFYLSVAIERVTKSFNGETFVLYMKKRKHVFRNMQLHCEHVNNEYNCPFHVSFIV